MLEIVNNEELIEKEQSTPEISPIGLVEVLEVPSEFKPYPKGTKIFYKPITLDELEHLNSGSLNYSECCKLLLDSIVCEGIDKYDLAYFDFIYVGIQRKLMAFGDIRGRLQLDGYCPACGNGIISKEFKYTELDFEPIKAEALPIITEVGGVELEFLPVTIGKFLNTKGAADRTDILALLVSNKPFEEARKIIGNASGSDIQKVYDIEALLDYGIKPITGTCNGKIMIDGKEQDCNYSLDLEVTSPFEVTFPINPAIQYSKSEIRFGRG